MSRTTMVRRSDGTSRTIISRGRDGVIRMMIRGYNENYTGWNKTATRKRSRGSNM